MIEVKDVYQVTFFFQWKHKTNSTAWGLRLAEVQWVQAGGGLWVEITVQYEEHTQGFGTPE